MASTSSSLKVLAPFRPARSYVKSFQAVAKLRDEEWWQATVRGLRPQPGRQASAHAGQRATAAPATPAQQVTRSDRAACRPTKEGDTWASYRVGSGTPVAHSVLHDASIQHNVKHCRLLVITQELHRLAFATR